MSIKEKLQAGATLAGVALPDALIIGGAGLVSYGAWLVYQPAGFAVAGAFSVVAGWLLTRGSR